MALPTLQKRAQKNDPTSRKRKIGVDAKTVEILERCRSKNRRIQKQLKHSNDMSNFELDADIDKALKSLGRRYEKKLDEIIDQLGIGNDKTPVESQTVQSSFFERNITT